MLSCEELRQLKLTDPRRLTPEMRQHLEGCPPCAGFAESIDVLETKVARTFEVAPPRSLQEDILRRHVKKEPRIFPRYALAAGFAFAFAVVLAVGLALRESAKTDPLALAVLAHVRNEEPTELASGSVSTDPIVIERVMMLSGLSRKPGLLEVAYVGRCSLREIPGAGTGAHIVLRTVHGKATLILWPQRQAVDVMKATEQSLSVIVMPAGKGSLAVVADSPEEAEKVARLVL